MNVYNAVYDSFGFHAASNNMTLQQQQAADDSSDISVAYSDGMQATLNEYYRGLYIHPHWQRRMDVILSAPDSLFYALGVYITVVCIVGVVGNATVIAMFARLALRSINVQRSHGVPLKSLHRYQLTGC